jgi:hypothetical protein
MSAPTAQQIKTMKNNVREPDALLMEDYFDRFIFEDEMVILPNGTISIGIAIRPVQKDSLSEEDMEHINELMVTWMKVQPPNTFFHAQEIHYDDKDTQFNESPSDGYFARNKKQYYAPRKIRTKILDIYISCNFGPYKVARVMNNPLIKMYNQWFPPVEIPTETQRKKARDIARSALAALKSIGHGIEVKQMEKAHLQNRVFQYIGLAWGTKPGGLATEFSGEEKDYLKIGNQYLSFVRLHEPGESADSSIANERGMPCPMMEMMGEYLDFPHVINLVIGATDKAEEIKSQKRKKSLILSMGAHAGSADIARLNYFDEFIQEAETSDLPIVNFWHNVMVLAPSVELLEQRCRDVITVYSKCNGSIGVVETMNTVKLFNTMTPGHASFSFDPRVCAADYAFCYFNYTGELLSDKLGHIFCNRQGAPVYVNFRNPKLAAHHLLLIGPTGSGKSFTANDLFVQAIEMGYEIVIIDVGGSYRNICETMGGTYLEYDPENPLKLNPFAVPWNSDEGKYTLSGDKSIFLRNLLTLLWKDTSRGEYLTKNEDAILSELLQLYYDNIPKEKYPRLSFFVEFIESFLKKKELSSQWQTDLKLINMDSFLLTVRKFTKGVYVDMLNADSNTSLSDDKFVVIDMKELQKSADLQAIVSLILIDAVTSKLNKNISVPKIFAMDEAWSFLKGSPLMSNFIENGFRTFRKLNTACFMITQGVLELKSSLVGEAIRNNCAIKVLLDHKGQEAQFPDLQSFLGFTDLNLQLLMSLRKGDTWREAFIKMEDYAFVTRTDVGPHSMAAYSTHPQDRAKMKELLARYKRVDFAIDAFVDANY